MTGHGAILLLSLLLWPPDPQPDAEGSQAGSKGDDAAPQRQHEVVLQNGLAGTAPAGGLAKGTWGPPCHQLPPSQPGHQAVMLRASAGALQQECWALDKLIVLQGAERSF